MPTQAERLIQLRRHEQEARSYPPSSRWYTGLNNAIHFFELAEASTEPMQRFHDAWHSVYNLLMMHGVPGDEEFKRFNRWVTTVQEIPQARSLIQEPNLATFRGSVKKAEKALLFDTEKGKWREGRQHLDGWSASKGLSADKAIRYFLIIVRDVRNACSHAEFNPKGPATRKALTIAADCLMPIAVAAIQATIERPVEGTTGRTTAYRSFLWPYLKNSDSFFSDYYLERLFPDEELDTFPEDPAKAMLKDIGKQWAASRSGLATADAEQTNQQWFAPVAMPSLGIHAHQGVRIVAADEIFEPAYVLAHCDLSDKPRPEYKGKDAGRDLACLIWTLAWRDDLDAVPSDSAFDSPPVELIHRALTASDVRWAVLTNGRKFRLLNKETAHKPRSFLEIDVTAIMDQRGEEEALLAFRYFLGLFSGDSFIARDSRGATRLDRVVSESERHGRAISDELKENVFKALEELGDGFLQYLRSNHGELREWRDEKKFSGSIEKFLASDELLQDIYHESLSLMYRLLFLFYAEGRNLLPMEDELYRETYSLESIRDDVRSIHDDPDPKRFYGKGGTDLWGRLKELCDFVNTGWRNIIPAYNGGLFDPERHEFLERFKVGDYYLARAVDLLSRTTPKVGGQVGEGRKKITYRDLEIRHLGSIYEGILEYIPLIANEEQVVIRRGSGGSAYQEYSSVSELSGQEKQQLKAWREAIEENPDNAKLPRGCRIEGLKEAGQYFLVYGGRESKRKSSGSYYTPDYIVQYIVENTLGPLVRGESREDGLKNAPLKPDEILDLKVLDPAMGSAHFLVAATEYLARTYGEAVVRNSKDPGRAMSDQEFIRYKRIIAERCIYGVDINPMAVELAKLSMWLFTMDRGRPLSFLDHHLKCGNSIVGAWIGELGGPPEFDGKGKLKRQRPSQDLNLFETRFRERVPLMVRDVFGIMARETLTAKDIELKKALEKAVEGIKQPFGNLADIFVGAHFGEEAKDYHALLAEVELARKRSSRAAREQNAFHWELEFPEVWFDESGSPRVASGFHGVIGNPPWGAAFSAPELSYHRHRNQEIIVRMIDAFMYFLYQGSKKLKSGGTLGMILPDTFLYQTDNEKLRRFILNTFSVRSIVNVGNVFEGVTRPACVVALENSPPVHNTIAVADISGLSGPLKPVKLSSGLEVEKIRQESVFDIPGAVLVTHRPARYAIWAKATRAPQRSLIDFIDEDGIQRGVSPDLKRAFIVDAETAERFRLESDKLKPVLTGGAQVKRYRIDRPDLYLIYTSRHDDFIRLPKIRAYIDQFRGDISCVEVKESKHPLYSLHRPREERIFLKKSKIIGVITEDRIVVALDKEKTFATDGLYLFSAKQGTNEKYLLGILNSKLITFLYRLVALEEGRALAQVKPTILGSLPVRDIDFENAQDKSLHDKVVGLAEQMLTLHERLGASTSEQKIAETERKIALTDHEIDRVVYELYGLADDEIAVVED
jgi:type I restriction-modification system DNA methylase subunit